MAEHTRRIVVNADDLGISADVNDAIFDAYDRGVVSSATLLVGGPAVEHALAGAATRPDLGVGLHLDTSEFAPLSREFATLRQERPDLDVRKARWILPAMERAIRSEWQTQLDEAASRGLEVTHIDSHHFDHVNPLLIPALFRVVRSSGIRKVRGMHNLWVSAPRAPVVAAKRVHRQALRLIGAQTTDYMCDVGTYLTLASRGRLPLAGSFELMAHPGHIGYADESARLLAKGPDVFAGELVSWKAIGEKMRQRDV